LLYWLKKSFIVYIHVLLLNAVGGFDGSGKVQWRCWVV